MDKPILTMQTCLWVQDYSAGLITGQMWYKPLRKGLNISGVVPISVSKRFLRDEIFLYSYIFSVLFRVKITMSALAVLNDFLIHKCQE